MTQKHRIFVITLVAWASSVFGLTLGGAFQARVKTAHCQRYNWGLDQLCQVWVGPTAWFQGSLTGAWVGMVLGAFLAGLATAEALETDADQ